MFLGFVAIATMIIGNVGALVQTKMKRLLAYSSIGQAGYIMLSIASFNTDAFSGGLLHSFAHAIMTVGAFVCVMIISSRTHTDDINDYKGLVRRMPWTAMAFSILLLSLAGIPPLIGFVSKLLIFLGAVEGAFISPILYWGALTMAVTSAISVYYYIRIIKFMLMDPPSEKPSEDAFRSQPRIPLSYAVPLFVTTTISGLFIFFAGDMVNFLNIVQDLAWRSITFLL
jgi:NADH:ubiquinone oxidoreductase subunit 2 (subunit N)